MTKRALFLIFGFLLSNTSHAIVSMENLHFGSAEQGAHGTISAGIDGAGGNSERVRASGSTTFQWNLSSSIYYLSFSGAYGKSQDVLSQQEAFAHARRIGNISDQLSWEFFSQLEHDEFARLQLKGLAGSGLRFLLGEKTTAQAFFLGTGAFYSHELIDDQATTENREFKGNFYILFKRKITDRSSFVNTLYVQPLLTDIQDYRVLEHATLKIDITNAIGLKLDLEIRHDNNPPAGVKETDWKYTTSINYSF